MREEVLRRFFCSEVSATALSKDLLGSTKQLDAIRREVWIEDMDEEFEVTRPMLVSLCDAVLSGSLPPEELATIGFALEASDRFVWDGDQDDVLANVIADWSCPEVNYPLTMESVARFRRWLTNAEAYPPRSSTTAEDRGKLISRTEKKWIGREQEPR